MSRSFKKNPCFLYVCCGNSQKKGKKRSSKAFRRIQKTNDPDSPKYPYKRYSVVNQHDLGGDGKFYWRNAPKKTLRK